MMMTDDQKWVEQVIEVADHIPNNQEIRSKLDAVEQVLKAAVDLGWQPPK